MPGRVMDIFKCWKGLRGNVHIAAMWKDRNARCFKERQHSLEELKRFFLDTLFSWASVIVCNGDSFHNLL